MLKRLCQYALIIPRQLVDLAGSRGLSVTVHISSKHKATIDSDIRKDLSAGEVALVEKSVETYNSLPDSSKVTVPASVASFHGMVLPNDSCPDGSGRIYGPFGYWWGQAMTLNHCLITQLWTIVYIAGSTAGVGSLICALGTAGACAVVEGIAGIYIAATVTALNSADGQCNNRGANLNVAWAAPVPWVNAVC